MPRDTIYTVGGTVQAGGGIYIRRKADDDLLELCRQGELAFILSSRQVGKSSLMTQTAEQLGKENIRSATIDLSSIGTKLTQDEWYLGILNVISTELNLPTDIFAWWTQYSGLGPAQRFFNFLRDVILKEIKDLIVLFFDEIDTTLSLPFADDFFACVRAAYNARALTPDFKRLSFVLVGVATPSDLISDNNRTPFNIGHRVELSDFTLKEAMPLTQGLGNNAEQVLTWVLEWTSGHPYLTQRLCQYLSRNSSEIDRRTVTEAAHDLFLGEQGQQDNNLQFVRDMLVKRSPDTRKVMNTYMDIRLGRKVADDERSLIKAHLKISGVVNSQTGQLVTRNRIYEGAFDPKWIKENTPSAIPGRLMIGSKLAIVFALLSAAYFAYQDWTQTDAERAAQFTSNFQAATDAPSRLKNLAGLFVLEGYSNDATALFNQLTQNEKLQLFAPLNKADARKNQVTVVKGLYQSMKNTDDENILLHAMKEAVRDAESTSNLYDEITAWLNGRKKLDEKDFYSAEANLMLAVEKNSENAAVYYDLAQAHISLENYSAALDDLAKMIQWDKNRGSDAYRLIQSNPPFDRYWTNHREEENYAELAKAVTIPMVLIPAGEFVMGSTVEQLDHALEECRKLMTQCSRDIFAAEQPDHRVYLDSYYIDQFEVTNARYAECVAVGVCEAPGFPDSRTRNGYYGNVEFDNYPVIYVSWFDANTYCEWRGASLPTEAEWEKAASWDEEKQQKYAYPWGNEFDGTKVNFCDKNCLLDLANKSYDDGYADTSPVANYESGQSPFSVYNMAGNVWEWVADWYSETYYQISPLSNPLGPDSGQTKVVRGGSWDNAYFNVRAAGRDDRVDPSISYDVVGFRCARTQ